MINTELSVCIPTYNRADYLRGCLEAFLPMVEPHQIPICVSDNGSTDHTVQVLEEFKRTRYPLLTYRSSESNRGIDQNMLDVVAMSTTRFAWLFGDDDLPCSGAIDKVLSCLSEDCRLVVVNAATYNSNLSHRVEERRIKLFEDQSYPPGDHNRLMVDTASYITYLGGLVVHVDSWRSVDAASFVGTDYLHVSVVFRYIVGQRAILCADPFIQLRLQRPTWYSRYFEVEMINWPRTVWANPAEHYTEAAKRAVVDEWPTRTLRRIMSMRGYGHYNRAAYEKFVAGDRNIPRWKRLLFATIAFLPQQLFRLALIAMMRTRRLWNPSRYELALFRLRGSAKW